MPDGGVVVGNRDDISHKKAGSDDKITQKTVTEPVLMDTVKASYASKVVGDSSKSNKASHSFFGEEVDHSSRYKILEDNGVVEGDSNPNECVTESKLGPTRILPTMSVKHKNVVVHREVSKNVAYLESNPPKKSSKKGVTINGAIVVPSMIGLDAAMVEYDLKVASGVRKVVKIVED
ncbi:hypothetical protein V6N13_082442 [Hibiscus sabdariffa]